MRHLLVLQFRGDSLADYDRLISLEDRLIEALGDSAVVDGHDVGSGETNLFIVTSEPVATFQQAKVVLQSTGQLETVTAAFRDLDGGTFVVIWPEGQTREFRDPSGTDGPSDGEAIGDPPSPNRERSAGPQQKPMGLQTLEEFLQDESGPHPVQGQSGTLTGWMEFCDWNLESGKVCLCDPSFSPPEPEMEVTMPLPAGLYRIEGRGIAFGSDRRTAILRCLRIGRTGERASTIGEVGVDTGRIGICDEARFGAAVEALGEDGLVDLLDDLQGKAGILTVAPGVTFPFVDSGFGDGRYSVMELRDSGEPVGFEVTLIDPDAGYPFGGSTERSTPSREANPGKHDNARGEALQDLLRRMPSKRTGDPARDKDALKAALQGLMQEQDATFSKEGEKLRSLLIAQRKAVPVLRTEAHPGSRDVLSRTEVTSRRKALERGGYRFLDVVEFAGIPKFSLVLFLHSKEGTTASISLGRTITTEVGAKYPDGRWFNVRDTAATPGMTPPPWVTYLHEAGRSIPEVISTFRKRRPAGYLQEDSAGVWASLAGDFQRVQEWRLERGGWGRDEVQAQMGIVDPSGNEDRITDRCLQVREKWLYAWLLHKDPGMAAAVLETLLIVHDELEPSMLSLLWTMGGGNPRVRRREFETRPAREAFWQVNQAQGEPLRRIAQKHDGFGADLYVPASV